MKNDNRKETLSIVLSLLMALVFFLILFIGLKWNLLLCMILTVILHLALSFLLKPVRKIGSRDLESLTNGAFLSERLDEASSDFTRMQQAVDRIREQPLRSECEELLKTAQSILKYLTDNPEKITAARRYIDYYQETAANVLEHYNELKDTGLTTGETEKVLHSTRESVSTLKAAFGMQFEKLMQNELMDMEADLNLLRQTLRSEGYTEPEKKKGRENNK